MRRLVRLGTLMQDSGYDDAIRERQVNRGVFGAAQKREMVQKLTDTIVEIEGENMRGVTLWS